MVLMDGASSGPLSILHVLRAPVGGLFRHVVDLARGQAERGHSVGLILDSTTANARAEDMLVGLSDRLALGISRYPFPRHLGIGDVGGVRHVSERVAQTKAQVIHGHGAKGGAYARLATAPANAIRAYTPHGGSLHYSASTPLGLIYLGLERILMSRGELFLFESDYSRAVFAAKVGTPKGIVKVVHNGIGGADFDPVAPAPEATDLLFIGELRKLKGIDLLIEALAQLRAQGRAVTATIVGSGPDEKTLHASVVAHDLTQAVRFLPAMPARQAFALGRVMVVPSRAESLPYIVLEAAGAGIPLIASRVGGIPEIFGPDSSRLVPPNSVAGLAAAIADALANPLANRQFAETLRQRVQGNFSADQMIDEIVASYRQALAAA
jgi:glycosyltransferase involved in cell wall biosynthesis